MAESCDGLSLWNGFIRFVDRFTEDAVVGDLPRQIALVIYIHELDFEACLGIDSKDSPIRELKFQKIA